MMLDQLKDFFFLALRNVGKRRLRSWLTLIGIFIGVASVVTLVSLGQGLQVAVQHEFDSLGMDKVFVSSAGSVFGMGGVRSLSDHDLQVLKHVRGVSSVSGYLFSTGNIRWRDESWWFMVSGIPADRDDVRLFDELFPVVEGRWFKPGERFKAVIGNDFAHSDFFHKPLKLHDRFSLNGQDFEVVGVFKKMGTADDRSLSIPLVTARSLFDEPDDLDSLVLKVKSGVAPSFVADQVARAMRKDRHLDRGEEDFVVQTFEDLLHRFLLILDLVTAVLVGIAAISLLVGAIGIANTMYTSVLERTREVGVLKAVGARDRDVLFLFLFESGLLGLVGGVLGVLLGMGVAWLVSFLAQKLGGFLYLQVSFPWWLLLGSLLFSFFLGVFAGVLPARRAARKNPVDALRYE